MALIGVAKKILLDNYVHLGSIVIGNLVQLLLTESLITVLVFVEKVHAMLSVLPTQSLLNLSLI